MARVTYGSGITEYNGSIGGITYQKNASGNIAKLRSNPTVNPTPLQATYQTRVSLLVAYWKVLTSVQQASWNALAAAHDHTNPWGDVKTISGYQWFLSCNLRHMLYSSAVIVTAPAWTAHTPSDPFTLTADNSSLKINWSPAYDPPFDIVIYVSLPLTQSSLKLRRSLYVCQYDRNAPSRTELDIHSRLEEIYNVNWFTFYNSAKCNIIVRILQGQLDTGLFSSFVSNIIKIT